MKIYFQSSFDSQPSRQSIQNAYLNDEAQTVRELLPVAQLSAVQTTAVAEKARHLIVRTREQTKETGGIEALLREYDLSSQEGVALMCLAEALLRIPDAGTADRLIKDKLNKADWERHLGQSHSLFVNASTWGFMLTGKLVRFEQNDMSSV